MFKRMFQSDMVEAHEGVVKVEDIEEETVEKMLEFVYSSEISDIGGHLENLFYAADKYQIEGLVCFHLVIMFHAQIISAQHLQQCLL